MGRTTKPAIADADAPADTAPEAVAVEAPPEAEPEPAPVAVEAAPVEAAPAPQLITVAEACTRLLDGAPRAYAGLYAFQLDETKAGRGRDTYDAYRARYADFLRRPV